MGPPHLLFLGYFNVLGGDVQEGVLYVGRGEQGRCVRPRYYTNWQL